MAQFLTFVTIAGIAAVGCWIVAQRILQVDHLKVTIRLDRSALGAHLIWDIVNAGPTPVTVTKLIIHDRTGATDFVPLDLPKVLAPQDRLLVPTDVDWTLLGARSIAAGDAQDGEHLASRRQLARIQGRPGKVRDERGQPRPEDR